MSRNGRLPILDESRLMYLHVENMPRAADIGRKLGGTEAMTSAIYQVGKLQNSDEAELQHVWDGIGQWKAEHRDNHERFLRRG